MDEFERLLRQHYGPLERFVKFRMNGTGEAEDLLQEVCLTAYEKFHHLRDREKFKPWILQIAQNKCRDYYRRSRPEQIPLETVEPYLTASRYGPVEPVRELLESMEEKDRMLLELTYFAEMSQAEIAQKLDIPVGTVKSRLYAARARFRSNYPYSPNRKGDSMKRLPEIMPEYTITPSQQPPFSVQWEEIMGWFVVPRLGEKLQWAMYDFPSRKRTTWTEMETVGRMQVHGIEGVEIDVLEHDPVPSEQIGAQNPVHRILVAQLTDTYCRILSETHTHNGVKEVYTFLDGDDFLGNWGFGPDNCGNPIHLTRQGVFHREGSTIQMKETDWPLDILGRYTVTIGGKSYDTVCVVDVSCYDSGVATEQFLDENGRTILWRRFNKDDWAFHHFKERWTERLPDNERLTINGETYVHWYDCITDYIL